MRETKFIEQNKEKWSELEQMLEKPHHDPEKLNDLFVQVTDDLSFSRTFYPNRSVRVYLNGLAQSLFATIYKLKKTERSKLTAFWTDDLPQLVYESRKDFRLSFGIFMLSLAIGVFSCFMEPDFVRQILGDSYVDMTLENIKSGDPMKVYKESGEFSMWLGITFNNLWVAFLTFITGIAFMIGSIWMLIRTGVMVGSFQYFFVEQGVFQESFLTIWIHGTFEISAIVIAGAAGMTMGRGLVFPGTLARLKAFQLSATRGAKIMFGITPIFILAAFFEGYLTRHTEIHQMTRLIFILINLFFIIGYFVWYPVYKARKGFAVNLKDQNIPPDRLVRIDYSDMKNVGQVFSETFIFVKNHFKWLFLTALGTAAIWCAAFFGLSDAPPQQMLTFSGDWSAFYGELSSYFVHEKFSYLPLLNGVAVGALAFVVFSFMAKDADRGRHISPQFQAYNFLKMAVGGLGVSAICAAPSSITILSLISIFPIILLWMYTMIFENRTLFASFSRTFMLAGSAFWQMMGVYAVLLITGALFMLIVDSGIFYIFIQFVGLNLYLQDELALPFVTVLRTFLTMTFLNLVWMLLLAGIGLSFHSLAEIRDADTLKKRIQSIGTQKKFQGMEWENAGARSV